MLWITQHDVDHGDGTGKTCDACALVIAAYAVLAEAAGAVVDCIQLRARQACVQVATHVDEDTGSVVVHMNGKDQHRRRRFWCGAMALIGAETKHVAAALLPPADNSELDCYARHLQEHRRVIDRLANMIRPEIHVHGIDECAALLRRARMDA